jgi:hypothetical protein
MTSRKFLVGTALALLASCGTASAEALQFTFSGTVISSNNGLDGVSSGTLVSGSFNYDPSTPFDMALPDIFANYDLGADSGIAVNVGGHDINAGHLYATIFTQNNAYRAQFTSGGPLSIDGIADSLSYANWQMILENSSGSVSTYVLPTSYDIAKFDAASSLTLISGKAFIVVKLDAIKPAVPEPSTMAMLVFGLGGLCMAKRRSLRPATDQ